MDILRSKQIECTKEKAVSIAEAMKERITFPSELFSSAVFYFSRPEVYDLTLVSKKWNETAQKVLSDYADQISKQNELSKLSAQEILESVCQSHGIKTGAVLQLLRISITGAGAGPDLMLTLEILGGNESATRIQNAIQKFLTI